MPTSALSHASKLRADVGNQADDAVRTLTAAWVAAADELAPGWGVAVAAVAALAVELGRQPHPWELARLAAVRQAVAATDQQLEDLGRRADKTITEAAAAAIAITLAAEAVVAASHLPFVGRAAAVALFAAAVPANTADKLQAAAAERIATTIRSIPQAAGNNVRRALVWSAPGTTPQVTSRRLTTAVEAAFHGGLTRAITTTRVETFDANRSSAHAFRVANRDHIRGWVWLSTLGRTTCAACWVMHGTVHPADETGPAGHPNCKCIAFPLLHGVDVAIPDARARFNALPEADQTAILGRRLALLRAGRIDWADLATLRNHPGWRAAYHPRSVAELQRIAARHR